MKNYSNNKARLAGLLASVALTATIGVAGLSSSVGAPTSSSALRCVDCHQFPTPPPPTWPW